MNRRINFDKDTLKLIFNKVGLGTKELSLQTDTPPSTLKQWKNGSRTMPLYFFYELCTFNLAIEKYHHRGEVLDVSWGQVKGGKNLVRNMTPKELKNKMVKIRSKICIRQIKNFDSDDVLEFYGIMMGDGCISEYFASYEKMQKREVRITGNAVRDRRYFEKHLLPIVKRLFRVKIKLYFRKDSNVVDLVTKSRNVSSWLIERDFPLGKKTELRIPNWITSKPPEKINNVIRGLFDTDGCISARKDERYKYPYIFIASESEILKNQIKTILREQGLPAYIHGHSVVVRGCKNIKKWFNLIGSNNPRNYRRYQRWLKKGYLRPWARSRTVRRCLRK